MLANGVHAIRSFAEHPSRFNEKVFKKLNAAANNVAKSNNNANMDDGNHKNSHPEIGHE